MIKRKNNTEENEIRKVWRAARSFVKERATFATIKDLVGEAGLPVEQLSHLQQKSLPERGASKSALLDAVDDLINNEINPSTAIQHLIEAFLRKNSHLEDELSTCFQRLGWGVKDNQLRPLDFHVEEAFVDLSEEVKSLLNTAYDRHSHSDYAGAMTAICSALDSLTARVYEQKDLGDPHRASYQERANRSFLEFEDVYKRRFSEAGIDRTEVNLIWQNYKGSINQAAYVLGSFRRNVSDVHGSSKCPPKLVRHAIDCGTFIIRSIMTEMTFKEEEMEPPDPA